ncbi:MAG TPA: PAS domain S-box protein [Acidimicrobiales bacterium]|nr:PAS domain S-box protein [Acidimicrobiales bacterium]
MNEPADGGLDGAGEAEALLALAHDAVIVRSPGGKIRFWNRGAEETYGWTAGEVVGRAVEEVLRTPAAASSVIEESLASGGAWEGRLTHVRRDGSGIVVACRVVRHEDGDGRPVSVLEIHRDVTAESRAEQELRESEERFRLLVDGVADYAIFMLDVDGHVVSWNSGAERIKGYRREEICGRHFSVFYPPEDAAAGMPAEELRKAAADGRVGAEGWRVRKDGSRFWASITVSALRDPAGVLRGFAKVTRDATDRKRFEEHLERQARLLDTVSDAVIAADEQLVLTAWNQGAERLYGWPAQEVLGRPAEQVLATKIPRSSREEALRVLVEGGEWRGEVLQRHRDGTELLVEAAAIVLPEGPAKVVSVNRDVTEARRAMVAEERNRLARELHDSVSQALFSMTLQARALELALAREGVDPGGPVSDGIAQIRQLTQGALAEMRALIFELRPGALSEEGLGAALRKLAAALEAKEGLRVDVSAPADRVPLPPDVEENLYGLAREALSNVVKHARASTVRIRLDIAPDRLELEIADDGVGFDTGASRPGHLGLKTMSERAAGIDGRLDVVSAPGGGTAVRVTVPTVGA